MDGVRMRTAPFGGVVSAGRGFWCVRSRALLMYVYVPLAQTLAREFLLFRRTGGRRTLAGSPP